MADPEALSKAASSLLREVFHGDDAGTTWIVDGSEAPGGNAGLLATAERLSAEEASRAPAGEGASIAAHVEHVRWFLALLNAYARGERPEIDWTRSWGVSTVDEEAWSSLRAALREEADAAAANVERALSDPDLPQERLMPILATLTHCGYHLGAVRQMVLARTTKA